jgi:hypothetical protein
MNPGQVGGGGGMQSPHGSLIGSPRSSRALQQVDLPVAGSSQMIKSFPVQQSAQSLRSLTKHRPGQHVPPHRSCIPFSHGVIGAAVRPLGTAPTSAPASSARQAVRRDPAIPKRRVRRSKVWWSNLRSSVTTLSGERHDAAGSMAYPRTRKRDTPPVCRYRQLSCIKSWQLRGCRQNRPIPSWHPRLGVTRVAVL